MESEYRQVTVGKFIFRVKIGYLYTEAGLWLAGQMVPGSTVMSRFPAIAFHAGADWAPTPNAEASQVVSYARAHGARYFVLDQRETIAMRPQLAMLINLSDVPGLKRLHEITEQGQKLVIFEVEP